MSFAHSKIQRPVPRRGLLLPRPTLEQRLVRAIAEHRAVLVSAPAGYGKTASLVRAVEQLPPGFGVAWVSLDPGDDLHRLLECLTAALEVFDPPWRLAPEALIATALRGDPRSRQSAVDELVNALDACDLAHGVIVLDDLHHLDDEPSRHFLDRWLERLPERWTLVLSTREDPPLALARLAAAGELVELRQADLQFDLDEAIALFAQAGIDAETATALHRRSAGWAAGMRLAATGARGGGAGSAIDRQAFDFLTTEVLARLDPELRDFLLATSVLHDLDAARCRELTGDARAAAWLDDIERLGLFVSVVDESSRTLRLHDLFRDALQHRLRIERGDEWQQLLQRAAAIETDPVRRQALLLRAQRHDEAAAELLQIGWPLMFQGAVQTLLRLIDAFPADAAARSAELQHVTGLARWHVWQAREAERRLAQAEALYAARADTPGAQTARAHRALTLVARGRLSEAGPLLDALRGREQSGEVEVILHVCDTWQAMESGAFNTVAPRFAALLRALVAVDRLECWTLFVPSPRLTACPGVAPLLSRWAEGALEITGDRPLPSRALAFVALGWQALWQGRIGDAALQLERADASARWTGEHVIARSHSLALRALLQWLRGEGARALATSRERLADFPGTYGDWGLWQMLFFVGRVAAAVGDAAELRAMLARLDELQTGLPDLTPARLQPLHGLRGTLAWIEGRSEPAIAAWLKALEQPEAVDLLGQASELRVRLALARLRAKDLSRAAAAVRELLDASGDGPGGAVFAAPALKELAAAVWGSQLGAQEVRRLQAWSDALAAMPTAPRPDEAEDGKLSARELEVVALIARGQSNKLIARALDLSPHTVKRHVANALAKLELGSRSQAAAWYHRQGPTRGV